MKPDRQVAAALDHFLNSAGWTVDHLYASFTHRAGLTQPYFRQGWGDLSIINFADDAKLLKDWSPGEFELNVGLERSKTISWLAEWFQAKDSFLLNGKCNSLIGGASGRENSMASILSCWRLPSGAQRHGTTCTHQAFLRRIA